MPKGHLEPGETAAAAAAREASEEAGVSGRLDPTPLGVYAYPNGLEGGSEVQVEAYLLEVEAREAPAEGDRTPTWSTPAQAKERLAESRSARHAAEGERIVDAAVKRLVGA